MWAKICNNKIRAPYFLDGVLTDGHWAFLELQLIPNLTRRFPDDNADLVNSSIRKSAPHNLHQNRDILNRFLYLKRQGGHTKYIF